MFERRSLLLIDLKCNKKRSSGNFCHIEQIKFSVRVLLVYTLRKKNDLSLCRIIICEKDRSTHQFALKKKVLCRNFCPIRIELALRPRAIKFHIGRY